MQDEHSSNWQKSRLDHSLDAGLTSERQVDFASASLWTAVGSVSFLAAGLTKTALGFFALCLIAFATGAEISGMVTGTSAAGFGAVALGLATGLVRPRERSRRTRISRRPQGIDLSAADRVAAGQPRAEARLVSLGDKQVLFSETGAAFLMYARAGRRLIALFDPVGAEAEWSALIDRFVSEAARQKALPIFYQASPRLRALLDPAAFIAHKQGELAEIDLARFDMKGKDWANLRRAVNRAERDGLSFELLSGADTIRPALAALIAGSVAWRAATAPGEPRYALGAFSTDYVTRFPVAVIRLEGRIVAFANLLPGAPGTTVFVDLMRVLPGTHRGAMDLLMVKIIEHLKASEWQSLNLGLAPLSGLDGLSRPTRFERAGHLLYGKSRRLYHFAGLRAFKEKFDPIWSPRYLVVPRGTSAFAAAGAAAVLIAGGMKGIFRR